jgi:hypothetical protein
MPTKAETGAVALGMGLHRLGGVLAFGMGFYSLE